METAFARNQIESVLAYLSHVLAQPLDGVIVRQTYLINSRLKLLGKPVPEGGGMRLTFKHRDVIERVGQDNETTAIS
jgi:hypothetical protein